MGEAGDGHTCHECAGVFGELDGFAEMVGILLSDLTVNVIHGEGGDPAESAWVGRVFVGEESLPCNCSWQGVGRGHLRPRPHPPPLGSSKGVGIRVPVALAPGTAGGMMKIDACWWVCTWLHSYYVVPIQGIQLFLGPASSPIRFGALILTKAALWFLIYFKGD